MAPVFASRAVRIVAGVALTVAVAAAASSLAAAQDAPRRDNVATRVPDLDGAWVRLDVAGSGSFGQLASSFTPAAVRPEYTEALARRRAATAGRGGPPAGWDPNRRYQNGEAYIVTAGTCGFPGGIEPNSSAFHIVQGRDEVVIVRENPGLGRNIYMDGRSHPDLTRFQPTATGHSIGRYEGDTLVIDTIGLTEGPVPAGGYRRPETRVIERYRLSADGRQLVMQYTFEDPVIYERPHTFELVAERGDPAQFAFEWWCDSSDPRQKEGVAPPKQN